MPRSIQYDGTFQSEIGWAQPPGKHGLWYGDPDEDPRLGYLKRFSGPRSSRTTDRRQQEMKNEADAQAERWDVPITLADGCGHVMYVARPDDAKPYRITEDGLCILL